MMRLLGRQFGLPQGRAGAFVGRLMAWSNRELNGWVASVLDVQLTDCILEIGFGPGTLIRSLAAKVEAGYIVGIDPSPVMLEQATRLNQAMIDDGRVLLEPGTVGELIFQAMTFDRVVSVNTFHLWPDPVANLGEVYRVLKPGGQVVIALQPRWLKRSAAVDGLAQQIASQVSAAGFRDVRVETKALKPVAAFILRGTR